MKYLLDTNMFSELMRPQPSSHALAAFKVKCRRCALAAPALYELEYGIAVLPQGARREALSVGLGALAGSMRVLPFDRAAARWLALASAKLRAAGRPSGLLDGQIAAIAATRDRVLVTRNMRHFIGYDGIRIENWFE